MCGALLYADLVFVLQFYKKIFSLKNVRHKGHFYCLRLAACTTLKYTALRKCFIREYFVAIF